MTCSKHLPQEMLCTSKRTTEEPWTCIPRYENVLSCKVQLQARHFCQRCNGAAPCDSSHLQSACYAPSFHQKYRPMSYCRRTSLLKPSTYPKSFSEKTLRSSGSASSQTRHRHSIVWVSPAYSPMAAVCVVLNPLTRERRVGDYDLANRSAAKALVLDPTNEKVADPLYNLKYKN